MPSRSSKAALGRRRRACATVALEQLGSAPRAVAADLVARVLDDPDANVRVAALDRLAQAAPDRALPRPWRGMRDPIQWSALRPGAPSAPSGTVASSMCSPPEDPERSEAGIEAARRLEPEVETQRVADFVRSATARVRPTTPSSPPFPLRPRRRPFSGRHPWIAAGAWRGPRSGPRACWSRNGSRCRRRSTGSTGRLAACKCARNARDRGRPEARRAAARALGTDPCAPRRRRRLAVPCAPRRRRHRPALRGAHPRPK